MAMLAGPRRKQKVINLRAKNNLWSNDSNKFGQRMLEKMGWSSGKGLGAHENGIVEHVVAKYKNDDRGLGFEDKNDQWTKHEDDFNSLLANLSNSENNTENQPSGISLEVKSKKSKARIHYHKYTRGKDLSRYSEKELANIFGKKSFKEETVEEPLKDDVKKSEQVFTEKGSMDDYFKNKLASLKLKSKLFNKDKNDEEITEYGFQGFSATITPGECKSNDNSNNGFQPFSFYGTQPNNESNAKDTITPEEYSNESEQVIKKKKKKKSKCKDIISSQENCIESIQDRNEVLITDQQEVPTEGKKSKKKKIQNVEVQCDVTDNIPIKKKKKKSRENSEILQDDSECVDYIPKKKKKRKNKDE